MCVVEVGPWCVCLGGTTWVTHNKAKCSCHLALASQYCVTTTSLSLCFRLTGLLGPWGWGPMFLPMSSVLRTQELARQTPWQQGEHTASSSLLFQPLSSHGASDMANSKARCLRAALGPSEAQGAGL